MDSIPAATVNAAAMLPNDGLTLSPAVHAALPPGAQQRFVRRAAPERYVLSE